MAEESSDPVAGTAEDAKQIGVQRIYIKDSSFEAPNTPEIYAENWNPQTNLNIKTASRNVGEDTWEVVLTLTVDAKMGETTAFLIELHQAGLFTLRGYGEDEMRALLSNYCPSLLYPYGREAVSSLVSKGGFPQLLLQPINFDALYAQAQQTESAQH